MGLSEEIKNKIKKETEAIFNQNQGVRSIENYDTLKQNFLKAEYLEKSQKRIDRASNPKYQSEDFSRVKKIQVQEFESSSTPASVHSSAHNLKKNKRLQKEIRQRNKFLAHTSLSTSTSLKKQFVSNKEPLQRVIPKTSKFIKKKTKKLQSLSLEEKKDVFKALRTQNKKKEIYTQAKEDEKESILNSSNDSEESSEQEFETKIFDSKNNDNKIFENIFKKNLNLKLNKPFLFSDYNTNKKEEKKDIISEYKKNNICDVDLDSEDEEQNEGEDKKMVGWGDWSSKREGSEDKEGKKKEVRVLEKSALVKLNRKNKMSNKYSEGF